VFHILQDLLTSCDARAKTAVGDIVSRIRIVIIYGFIVTCANLSSSVIIGRERSGRRRAARMVGGSPEGPQRSGAPNSLTRGTRGRPKKLILLL
jgi:hypothetical protein